MRKNRAEKRDIVPDPVYDDAIVSRIINKLMLDGKKGLAEKAFYGALDIISEQTGESGLTVVNEAIENIKPALEVKSRRVGGSNYQVPVEVDENRKITLSLRWLVTAARSRSEKTMQERIAGEIMDAYNNTGGAVRKKEEVHRMAEANRAFAHYRW
ncbi:30S ribosomal protein S7 [Halanaerobium salsuginis]|uniref:Small ribosomal subunit protein uS7 n=1 Tax=Halanaerobium salsuginis TaxID=29563 RepID=A0A1I4NEK4_9FIRM|nr:30S ribosomal protein S7 [Halanaerobium salsuginis]SFM13931.1 SSU ribosomal protein S7P [Halanaerobium salsuginis]